MNVLGKGVVFGLIGLIVVFVMMYISYSNAFVRAENGIIAQDQSLGNVLSSYELKIMEMAAIPAQYKEDLREIIEATFQGRYGDSGSDATFQALRESNIPYDSSMMKQMMSAIEAGRDEYKMEGKILIDRINTYKNKTQTFPGSMFAGFTGHPKIDLERYRPILTDSAETTLKTRKATAIKPFGN